MIEECDALRKRVDELTAQLGFVVAVADDRKARVDALTDALRALVESDEEVDSAQSEDSWAFAEGGRTVALDRARRVLGEA